MGFRGKLALALATALGAVSMTGSAYAAQGLVVQQREPGPMLLAHRYQAGPTGQEKLTVVLKPDTDFKTITLLDFDRDGQPDGMVNMAWNAPTQQVVWQLWKFSKRPIADGLGTGSGPCFVPGPTAYSSNVGANPGGQDVSIDKRSGSWAVTATGNFDQFFGDDARYQPKMVTMHTTSANSLGSSSATAEDYLPNSAAPNVATADTGCMARSVDDPSGVYRYGLRVARDGWSDRGQGTAQPAVRQTMLDATDATAESDLVEVDVEQYNASQQTGDVTSTSADTTTPGTGSFHPTDIVLRFAGGSGKSVASATYLFPAYSDAPNALVVTNPDPDHPDRVDVELHYGLSGLHGDGCYPRSSQAKLTNGSDWGPAPYRLTLPLTTDDQGRQIVRVALDHLLGIYQNALGDTVQFDWIAATVPGGLGAPDYLPETTAVTPLATCQFSDGSYGTTLHPSQDVRMSQTVPQDLTLTASNTSPTTSEDVTLTANGTGATHFQFQPTGAGAFTADGANTVTQRYATSATARVYAWANDRGAQMADLRITPANSPPTAGWLTTGDAAPYVLSSSSGVTVIWNDNSHDSDGTVDSHAWTLTKDGTAREYTSTGSLLSHTFNAGDQGNWTIRLKVTDDDGATATKTDTIRIIQPPVAIIDKITPCPHDGGPHTGPDGCTSDLGPIVWDQYAGGQYKVWARTADDGSLGSETPLNYYFQWYDESGDTWNLWTVPYASSFTAWPGSYPVKMKVVDAGNRESSVTTAYVNVRAPGDLPPTAHLSVSPAQPESGAAALLDASASVLNNPDGTTQKAFSFRYDFGDGSAPLVTTEDAVSHVYAGSGHYTASVVAIDDRSFANNTASDPVTVDVHVAPGATDANAPVPAIARTSPTGKVYAQRDVTLSAVGTKVVTGPAHYAWDLDSDGTFETDGDTQAVLTTQYATAGHRDVRVRVTDGEGRVAISTPLGLDVAAAPVLAPTVTLNGPDTANMGDDGIARANLDASGSHGNNDDPSLTYLWDLDGDGTFETDTGSNPHAQAHLLGGGDQTVRVTATDAFGNKALATKKIFVRSAADIAAGCQGREQYRGVVFKLVRVYGCWTSVDRPNAGPLWIAHGEVSLNGLRLQAGDHGRAADQQFADCATAACATAQRAFNDEQGGGRAIALDLHDGHLVSNAPVAIKASGSGVSLTLNDAPIDAILPESADDDGLLLHPPSGMKLLTLNLASTAEVTFPALGQASVGVTVHLPPQLPGAGGDLTLRSTETQGLILDHLRIEVQTGVLSDYLKLGSLALEYDRPDDQWTGSAELGLPGIKGKEFDIEVEVVIKGGKFHSIYGAVDGLEVSLGEGVFLQRIRAGVGVDPLDIQGGLGISAGPKIFGTQLLSADGDMRVTFPSAAAPYTLFQISGGTKLLDTVDLSRGVLRFATNGFFEARYGYTRDVGIAYFDADLGGWFTFSKANFTGNAEAGIKFLGDRVKLVGAHAVLSTKGIAACGEIPVIEVGGGVGYRWGDDFDVFKGCDLGPYSEARPAGIPDGFSVRTAAVRAPAVDLPANLRSAGITVHGRGGVPKVKVVDLHGTTMIDATKESLTKTQMVVFDPNANTTTILWKAPPKGRYLVLAAPGSPGLGKVERGLDTGPQLVRASVRGHGAKRRVHWRVTPKLQKGQQVTLGEATALDGAGSEILTTAKSSGTARFVPEDGHGEQRVITATIITDGLGRPSTVAGRFAAPRLVRPARPAGVTLSRSGRTVHLRWTPARHAAAPAGGWRIGLRAGTLVARSAVVSAKHRSATFKHVPVGLSVSASVAGLTASRMAGMAGRATLAPGVSRSGGASGPRAAKPRRVRVRRSGRKLVVRWHAGAEQARAYVALVRIGQGRPLRLTATRRHPAVTVTGLPRKHVAVRVEVRALRVGGGLSPAAVVHGRR
ncbi:MAG TPA: PKD domain-containing protein [Baekduia sp.]|nr:PKD domain-containing protein [Baekduia sp.]